MLPISRARSSPWMAGAASSRSQSRCRARSTPCTASSSLLLQRNVLADAIFLLVQHSLFILRDVAVVLRCHVALFLADLMVLRMFGGGLAAGQGAVPDVLVDAPVLVLEPIVDLGTSRMVLLPGGLAAGVRRERSARIAAQRRCH